MTEKIKKVCSFVLVLSLLFCSSTYAAAFPFPDIAGHWAEGIITTLVERGVINGFPDGTAKPDNIIIRGEFTALLVRHLKLDTTKADNESPTFDDIDGHWSEKNIETLVDSGILDPGDHDGSLLPNEPITRIEIIRMMVRAIGKGEEAKQFAENTSFKDDNAINASDKGYVILAKKYDLITGYPDNTIRPEGKSTRAEAFALLLRQEEALDIIKKELEEKEIEKEKEKEQSSGGSASYPKAQVAFELPAVAHTDTNITVTTVLKYTKTMTWSLTRGAIDSSAQPLDLAEAVDGKLTKDGGTIVFKESGSYTLTATATNYNGKTTSCSQSITVYPVVDIAFELPQRTHTDKTISIEAATAGLGALDIVWSVIKDGEAVAWDTAIDGTLNNEGGKITFKEKGTYGITATVNDDTGRSFSHSSSITVYPVVGMFFDLPGKAHTDTIINLTTTLSEMEGLTIDWSLTRNGEATAISDCIEGELTNAGGTIRFKEKGVYVLTATVTDGTGRDFITTASAVIYPVGEAGFYLPEITHTDTTVTVEATFEEVADATVVWTLTKDGSTAALNDYIEGALTNGGGSIRFTHKGEYILKAAFTDGAGRTYSYTSEVTVYPVPKLTFNLPATAHTDTVIPVTTTTEDMDGLTIEWLVDNTYGFQDWATYVDGTLNNDGGKIRFKRAGVYELVARVADATGRVFLFEYGKKTEVHPVLSIRFELPEATHTDRTIDLRTTGNIGILPIEWSITKNGKAAPLETYVEGTLNTQGGKIRFIEDGEYVLAAKMTDALNRTLSHSSTVVVYPIPEVEFILPEAVHTDKTVDVAVRAVKLGDLNIEWSITRNDEAVKWQDFIDGTLTNGGGSIRFTDKGNYILTASITDELGRSFQYTASTEVYPIPQAGFILPETAYTDKAVDVAVAAAELGNLDIVWAITRNGETAKWEDCIDGILTNEGGSIQFNDKGAYVLKAAITDELGRSFEYNSGTTVYPIPKAEFILSETTYTDKTVNIAVSPTELGILNIAWFVTRNGAGAEWDSCIDGSLTNEGGSIRFKNKGDYTLKASITDELGRSFEYTASTEVYPIPKAEFVLPATTQTDKNVEVLTTLSEIGGLQVVWSLTKNGNTAALTESVEGTLSNAGGTIRFKDKGVYVLKAAITDALGRSFEYTGSIQVYPVPTVAFTLPEYAHTDTQVNVSPVTQELGALSIAWKISKDGGNPATYSSYVTGVLTNAGGNIIFRNKGTYLLTANVTDETGRVFSYAKIVSIRPVVQTVITLPQTAHIGTNVTVSTQNTELGNLNISWELKKDGNTIPFASYTTGTLTNSGGTLVFKATGNYVLIAKVTDSVGRVFTSQSGINIYNNPPAKPVVTANVTRTVNNGKFLVTISANSTDQDNDAITYEYTGKAADNYYSIGTHTVKVRAKDEHGAYSEWAEVTFTVANQAPSTPVITRTPNGNSVPPGTSITITALSTDPEGDAITYVWEGRPAQTSTYPLGKNTVRVKAVDAAGVESPWTAIVFFVADSTNGGGMTLTGPESVILEEGIEGATIIEYTFTVPPVSGHSGSDYGQVRGYNKNTRQWDQLDYQTTKNGITFSRTLAPGIYTQLEFYYYTNHNCMYNKSNITYSVKYHFE